MAADILLYDADIVPVGKDQVQHLEITRDIAGAFNHKYQDSFVLPTSKVDESVMIIPGTDGQKMSKSYNNIINIFLPDKKLRKQIMSIQTDSLGLEESKDPDKCNVFNIYKLLYIFSSHSFKINLQIIKMARSKLLAISNFLLPGNFKPRQY